jgi:hypothetical protein
MKNWVKRADFEWAENGRRVLLEHPSICVGYYGAIDENALKDRKNIDGIIELEQNGGETKN